MLGDLEILDGDTVTAILDLGHGVFLAPQAYRLYGINSPEMRGNTREAGQKARDALRKFVEKYALRDMEAKRPWLSAGGYWLIARTHKAQTARDYRASEMREKYGRFLVELFGKDAGVFVNINALMVDNGFAVAYVP